VQNTQTITGLTPGTYSVCVSDANGCSVCGSTYVGFATGIIESNLENNISIYPNPTSGRFTLQANSYQLIVNSQIEIYNVLGECIYRQISTSANQQINLSASPDGIYFMKIKNEQGVITKKIILSH
jgi:hypothetical protein